MEVLFAFLSEKCERRSLMITSNLVFSEWDKIFKQNSCKEVGNWDYIRQFNSYFLLMFCINDSAVK